MRRKVVWKFDTASHPYRRSYRHGPQDPEDCRTEFEPGQHLEWDRGPYAYPSHTSRTDRLKWEPRTYGLSVGVS